MNESLRFKVEFRCKKRYRIGRGGEPVKLPIVHKVVVGIVMCIFNRVLFWKIEAYCTGAIQRRKVNVPRIGKYYTEETSKDADPEYIRDTMVSS